MLTLTSVDSQELVEIEPSLRAPIRRGRNGRPSKLTPEVTEKIARLVSEGSFYEPAAIAAGVAYPSMRQWFLQGQADKAAGLTTRFSKFTDALVHAQAQAETRMVSTLAKGGEGKYPDWRAQAFVLERRYPQRWAPPKAEQSAGITLSLTDAQLAALGEALRVAVAKPAIDVTEDK